MPPAAVDAYLPQRVRHSVFADLQAQRASIRRPTKTPKLTRESRQPAGRISMSTRHAHGLAAIDIGYPCSVGRQTGVAPSDLTHSFRCSTRGRPNADSGL